MQIEQGDVSFDRNRNLTAWPCFLRPSYLFAADEELIAYRVGQLDPVKLQAVFATLRGMFPETAPASVEELAAQSIEGGAAD